MAVFINKNAHYHSTVDQSPDVASFDQNNLFPVKSKSLKGGAYFNDGETLNSAYLLVNTKSSASPFLLSSKLTEALIFNKANKSISVNAVNNPLPMTYK